VNPRDDDAPLRLSGTSMPSMEKGRLPVSGADELPAGGPALDEPVGSVVRIPRSPGIFCSRAPCLYLRYPLFGTSTASRHAML